MRYFTSSFHTKTWMFRVHVTPTTHLFLDQRHWKHSRATWASDYPQYGGPRCQSKSLGHWPKGLVERPASAEAAKPLSPSLSPCPRPLKLRDLPWVLCIPAPFRPLPLGDTHTPPPMTPCDPVGTQTLCSGSVRGQPPPPSRRGRGRADPGNGMHTGVPPLRGGGRQARPSAWGRGGGYRPFSWNFCSRFFPGTTPTKNLWSNFGFRLRSQDSWPVPRVELYGLQPRFS